MLVLKIHRKVSAQGFQGVSFTDTLRVHTRACSAVLCWTTANHRYPECTAGKVTPILFTWRKPKTETTSLKGEEETKPKTKEQTSEEFAFGLSSLDMSQVFIFHSKWILRIPWILFWILSSVFLHRFPTHKGVSERSGTVRVMGGAAGLSIYGLQLCSYGK